MGYTGEDEESNMAVVEVEMVSGFVPSKTSLRELKKDIRLGEFTLLSSIAILAHFYYLTLIAFFTSLGYF